MKTRVVSEVGNVGWELSQIPASENIRDQKASSKGKRKAVDELLCACFNYPIILRFLCIDLNSSNKALSSPHSLPSIRALSIRYASKERNYSSSRLAWRKGKKIQMGGHDLFCYSICLNLNCSYNYSSVYFLLGCSQAEKFKT